MIIFRYLVKEVYTTLLAVAGVLLLTFLSNAFIRYLSRAASGKVSGLIVLKIMAIQIPYLLGLLLPVSLFVAFLLAYGRLYADNEMTVLMACGMSQRSLLNKSFTIALLILVLDAFFVFYLSPVLLGYQNHLLVASPQKTLLQTLQPGRFQVANGGKNVFYVEKVSSKKEVVENLFVAQQIKTSKESDIEAWNVLAAEQGYTFTDNATHTEFVVAQKGYRYSGTPGQKNFKIVRFDKYAAKLDDQPKTEINLAESMPTHKLIELYSTNIQAKAELQWRLSLLLAIPLLTFLAVPLSRIKPRQGRYAQLLPAVLIYAIYANMMFVAKNWVETEKVPSYLGMWWLHAALLFLAVIYWTQSSGVFLKLRRRRS